MGTINYRTSEYITLGVKPEYPDDLKSDADIMEWAKEMAENRGEDIDMVLMDLIYDDISDQYYQVKSTLEKYRFDYYTVTVESGYYEGFSVQISRDTPLYMEPWEKDAAYGEIKELEKFLMECVKEYGLVECHPGWCTGYEDADKSVTDIAAAMVQARKDIDDIPIWEDNEDA